MHNSAKIEGEGKFFYMMIYENSNKIMNIIEKISFLLFLMAKKSVHTIFVLLICSPFCIQICLLFHPLMLDVNNAIVFIIYYYLLEEHIMHNHI